MYANIIMLCIENPMDEMILTTSMDLHKKQNMFKVCMHDDTRGLLTAKP